MSQNQHVNEDHGAGHDVTITVDDAERTVRAGSWVVRDLKTAVGVDPAKVLAVITPQGLRDLQDDGKVAVHAREQFMSHARTGGSS